MGTKKPKNAVINHLPKKRTAGIEWFQKQITEDQFEIKQNKNGKHFAHHEAWKSTIWIGPYDTNEELSKVISSYVSVTKKPFGRRREIKNLHSIIIEEKEFNFN